MVKMLFSSKVLSASAFGLDGSIRHILDPRNSSYLQYSLVPGAHADLNRNLVTCVDKKQKPC